MVGLSSDSDLVYVYAYNTVLYWGGFYDSEIVMMYRYDTWKYISDVVLTYVFMIYNIKY